ncbi:MAG: LysM peptidoglycan-binding domain-containing protein [Bacilli bacterium]
MNNYNTQYFGTLYVVEEKDNLYSIAERFHTKPEQLKKINSLSSNLLYPGQHLIVDEAYNPKNLYSYEKYVVQPGETLSAIAYKYNMTTDHLKEINNLLSDEIKAGEKLNVVPTEIVSDENVYYTVKPGDSLYSIARAFHITLDELKSLNNLQNENLTVGQKLLVLTKETIINFKKNTYMYYIKPGDSLYSIANKTGSTVEIIKAVNKLTSDSLKVGQLILIPHQTK